MIILSSKNVICSGPGEEPAGRLGGLYPPKNIIAEFGSPDSSSYTIDLSNLEALAI